MAAELSGKTDMAFKGRITQSVASLVSILLQKRKVPLSMGYRYTEHFLFFMLGNMDLLLCPNHTTDSLSDKIHTAFPSLSSYSMALKGKRDDYLKFKHKFTQGVISHLNTYANTFSSFYRLVFDGIT